jgi:hypothetical protein
MNIETEKLFLRRIAASWGNKRNIGGFNEEERAQLQAMRIQGKVHTTKMDGSTWVMLTELGQARLYELNGIPNN